MKENEQEYKELYIEIMKSLSNHFIDADFDKLFNITTILMTISFKQMIINGMDFKGFREFIPEMQYQFNYLFYEANKKKRFFSDELKTALKDFKDMNIEEFINSKDAMKTLLEFRGVEVGTINQLIKDLK